MKTTEPKGKTWVQARDVCARYGNISTMTLWRWLRDPEMGFPQPRYIKNRRFWDETELDEFDRLSEGSEAA